MFLSLLNAFFLLAGAGAKALCDAVTLSYASALCGLGGLGGACGYVT